MPLAAICHDCLAPTWIRGMRQKPTGAAMALLTGGGGREFATDTDTRSTRGELTGKLSAEHDSDVAL